MTPNIRFVPSGDGDYTIERGTADYSGWNPFAKSTTDTTTTAPAAVPATTTPAADPAAAATPPTEEEAAAIKDAADKLAADKASTAKGIAEGTGALLSFGIKTAVEGHQQKSQQKHDIRMSKLSAKSTAANEKLAAKTAKATAASNAAAAAIEQAHAVRTLYIAGGVVLTVGIVAGTVALLMPKKYGKKKQKESEENDNE